MTKVCSKCKKEKHTDDFRPPLNHCKVCASLAQKKWKEANAEKVKAHAKKWRTENKDKQDESHKVWRKANPHKRRAMTTRQRAARLQRTPAWANMELISDVYELAAFVSEVAGELYHVDHIVPLQGKNVSGLHVDYNLQIIPAVENLRKSNKY